MVIHYKKIILLSVPTIVIAAFGYWFFSNRSKPLVSEDSAKTTSTAKTAQPEFDSGEYRDPGNSIKESSGSGGITSVNKTPATGTDKSNPLVSATGEITLYAPDPDTAISSGTVVTGASTIKAVHYRLIDSISGVIAMGEIPVVNGEFTGKLQFSTGAKEGRLDFYATRSNGSEYSSIEVPVRFNGN